MPWVFRIGSADISLVCVSFGSLVIEKARLPRRYAPRNDTILLSVIPLESGNPVNIILNPFVSLRMTK